MTFTVRQLYKFITNLHIGDVEDEIHKMQEEREKLNEEYEEE